MLLGNCCQRPPLVLREAGDATVVTYFGLEPILQSLGFGGTTTAPAKAATSNASSQIVALSPKQAEAIKGEPVREHLFPIEKDALGSIDFNEDMTLQVITKCQGRIIDLLAKIGDEVKKGQTLFTIDGPDLVQAVSTLISTAGCWSSPRATWRASGTL